MTEDRNQQFADFASEFFKPKPREKPVCTECGSDDVRADAYAIWNVELQEWEISATFDKGSVCESCGGECDFEWVIIDE